MVTKLELVLKFYVPAVEKSYPGKGDVAAGIIRKYWDSRAESEGAGLGLDGRRLDINQHTYMFSLRALANRFPALNSELKGIRA